MGGLGAEFRAHMEREMGREYVESLDKERQISVKAYDHYIKVKQDYETLRDELQKLTTTEDRHRFYLRFIEVTRNGEGI